MLAAAVSGHVTFIAVVIAVLVVFAAVGLDHIVGKIEWVAATTLFLVALIFFGLFVSFK